MGLAYDKSQKPIIENIDAYEESVKEDIEHTSSLDSSVNSIEDRIRILKRRYGDVNNLPFDETNRKRGLINRSIDNWDVTTESSSEDLVDESSDIELYVRETANGSLKSAAPYFYINKRFRADSGNIRSIDKVRLGVDMLTDKDEVSIFIKGCVVIQQNDHLNEKKLSREIEVSIAGVIKFSENKYLFNIQSIHPSDDIDISFDVSVYVEHDDINKFVVVEVDNLYIPQIKKEIDNDYNRIISWKDRGYSEIIFIGNVFTTVEVIANESLRFLDREPDYKHKVETNTPSILSITKQSGGLSGHKQLSKIREVSFDNEMEYGRYRFQRNNHYNSTEPIGSGGIYIDYDNDIIVKAHDATVVFAKLHSGAIVKEMNLPQSYSRFTIIGVGKNRGRYVFLSYDPIQRMHSGQIRTHIIRISDNPTKSYEIESIHSTNHSFEIDKDHEVRCEYIVDENSFALYNETTESFMHQMLYDKKRDLYYSMEENILNVYKKKLEGLVRVNWYQIELNDYKKYAFIRKDNEDFLFVSKDNFFTGHTRIGDISLINYPIPYDNSDGEAKIIIDKNLGGIVHVFDKNLKTNIIYVDKNGLYSPRVDDEGNENLSYVEIDFSLIDFNRGKYRVFPTSSIYLIDKKVVVGFSSDNDNGVKFVNEWRVGDVTKPDFNLTDDNYDSFRSRFNESTIWFKRIQDKLFENINYRNINSPVGLFIEYTSPGRKIVEVGSIVKDQNNRYKYIDGFRYNLLINDVQFPHVPNTDINQEFYIIENENAGIDVDFDNNNNIALSGEEVNITQQFNVPSNISTYSDEENTIIENIGSSDGRNFIDASSSLRLNNLSNIVEGSSSVGANLSTDILSVKMYIFHGDMSLVDID